VATFLKRYIAGEQVKVWQDLVALAERVREPDFESDARAVATETMRRVRSNVETLVERLRAMDYRFLGLQASDKLQTGAMSRLGKMTDEARRSFHSSAPEMRDRQAMLRSSALRRIVDREAATNRKAASAFLEANLKKASPDWNYPPPFTPADEQTIRLLDRLEKVVGPIPLSLRAWYEQVGSVSLVGWHSKFYPNQDEPRGLERTFGYPLLMCPLSDVAQDAEVQYEAIGEGEDLEIHLNPTISEYDMIVPDEAADAPFTRYLVGKEETLVEYLRRAFEWGGFPGWARHSNPPVKEIEALHHGLLPI
jgi:hypothetical protein